MAGKPDRDFSPKFEDNLENWTKAVAYKNLWRVRSFCSIEDLMQDGYMKFLQCVEKYPDCQSEAHFASLYRTAFKNHLNKLATTQSTTMVAVDPEILAGLSPGRSYNDGPLLVKLSRASFHLRKFLRHMQRPENLEKLRKKRVRYKHRGHGKSWEDGRLYVVETTNERWCKIMGYNPKRINLVNQLREILSD